MLMLEEALARVQTRLDVDTLHFTISQGNEELLAVNLDDERGRRQVEEFVSTRATHGRRFQLPKCSDTDEWRFSRRANSVAEVCCVRRRLGRDWLVSIAVFALSEVVICPPATYTADCAANVRRGRTVVISFVRT